MRTSVMAEGIAKGYRNRLVQEAGLGIAGERVSECIIFCERIAPNMFDIKGGVAMISDMESCFNDGVCAIPNVTKVVFVFDQSERPEER